MLFPSTMIYKFQHPQIVVYAAFYHRAYHQDELMYRRKSKPSGLRNLGKLKRCPGTPQFRFVLLLAEKTASALLPMEGILTGLALADILMVVWFNPIVAGNWFISGWRDAIMNIVASVQTLVRHQQATT
jgi:hypothetical protein